eukprot:scaffold77695_cov47-Phaeocystis_antarctica.AAC.2
MLPGYYPMRRATWPCYLFITPMLPGVDPSKTCPSANPNPYPHPNPNQALTRARSFPSGVAGAAGSASCARSPRTRGCTRGDN